MMYDSILARSFSRQEQKQLKYTALFACLLTAVSFCAVFKPYLRPLPVVKLDLCVGANELKMVIVKDTSSSSQLALKDTSNSLQMESNVSDAEPKKSSDPICKIMKGSDFCEINNGVRIDGSSATVFLASAQPEGILAENSLWKIRPYARKCDRVAVSLVKEWSVESLQNDQELPQCTQNHSVPALLFSNGGYAGNIFHDFSDIIIPLYINSRQFNGEVQFLVTNKQSWWVKKFQNVLKNLSKYDIIDIDQKNKDIHCFTRGIIGLKRHEKELHIDPSKSPYSIKDFREFIRSSYSLKKVAAIKLSDGENRTRPLLLIISRKRTREFTNTNKIAQMARRLGYDVVVTEAGSNLTNFAETVNSCDVLLGVHGAGLTNMVFLPEKAVLIQVIPFGEFGWLSRTDYEEPAKRMKLKYLEYKIDLKESSLIRQYPHEHEVLRDPASISRQGWDAFRSVYMVQQNVEIDLNRFRGILLKACELLHQ